MAKVKSAAPAGTEGTNANPEGAAPAAEKKPAAPRNSNIRYTFVKDPAEGQKFAPQAVLIVKHIQNAGADGIAKADLIKALAADEAFKTRQPIERIIGYYQKDLVNAGVISQGTSAPAAA
jgi:hypothetical protein